MATLSDFGVLIFEGVSQAKPIHGFLLNFQDIFTQEDLELIRFYRVFGNKCCHGNIFGFQCLWVFQSLNQCMDFHQIFKIVNRNSI